MYQIVLFTDVTDTVMVYKSIGAYKCAYELRKAGYSVLVVDNLHCFDLREFKNLIDLSVGPSTMFVGFSTTFLMNSNVNPTDYGTFYTEIEDSVFFPQGKDFAAQACKYIQQKNATVKIVVGGAKAHANWRNSFTDYAILGFSESSIVNLAHHLAKGAELKHSYRNVWGTVIVDDKVASEYDFKHNTFEWQTEDVLGSKVLPIEISRGCIFKCKFCSYPMIGKKNNDYIRDTKQIQQELQRNYDQFGVKYYYIIDDTFNDNQYKLECMLAAVKQLSFQPIFWAYTRLDLVARDFANFQQLYDIGVRGYYFGIETLNNATGKIIGKGYDKQRMVDAIKRMRDQYPDVLLHGSFIVGLPEESLDSATNTFERIMSQDIPLHSFNFKGLWLFNDGKVSWNSELSANFAQYGYQQIPETKSGNRIDINWKNAYTNRDQADQLAQQFNRLGRDSDFFRVPAQTSWGLLNYGNDYTDVYQTLYRDINWHETEKLKSRFVAEYKQQLFEFLTAKHADYSS